MCYSKKNQIFDRIVPRPNLSDFLCRELKKFENHWNNT
jgi:hypothetical protein